MPKLSSEQQEIRRARILDAAEMCFANNGFHRSTMQDICRRAGISAGALYIYFDSKEALIEGISARNREDVLSAFSQLSDMPDFQSGLELLLQQCILNQPEHKSRLWLDIGAEATRNDRIKQTIENCDHLILSAMTQLLEGAQQQGLIDPVLPVSSIAEAMAAMADGLFWRSAIAPHFDAATIGRTMLAMLAGVLRPVPAGDSQQSDKDITLVETLS
ncbi:MAG: TetR/AcrR family transcriptional regulator [Beijerinckiaceae bacterium]|jgi:TetR/AcrR family transcriptional regulator, repressor for uid operon|nr:TetR/AcrR family transcriptional regulator [Beijerinckiaceae bacterium]